MSMAKLLIGVCLVLGLAMAVTASRPPVVADPPAAVGCESDLQALMANCQDYIKFPAEPKIPPSAACCIVFQRANVPCLCTKVTPQVEQFICMDKVVYVAGYCKRPFPPGYQCGSYRVPGQLA